MLQSTSRPVSLVSLLRQKTVIKLDTLIKTKIAMLTLFTETIQSKYKKTKPENRKSDKCESKIIHRL